MLSEYKINSELKNEHLESIYNRLYSIYRTTESEDVLKEIGTIFSSMPDYKDSSRLALACFRRADTIKNDKIYYQALTLFENGDLPSLKTAVIEFERIRGWKDSADRIEECNLRISELRKKENKIKNIAYKSEHENSETFKIVLMAAVFGFVILSFQWLWNIFIK